MSNGNLPPEDWPDEKKQLYDDLYKDAFGVLSQFESKQKITLSSEVIEKLVLRVRKVTEYVWRRGDQVRSLNGLSYTIVKNLYLDERRRGRSTGPSEIRIDPVALEECFASNRQDRAGVAGDGVETFTGLSTEEKIREMYRTLCEMTRETTAKLQAATAEGSVDKVEMLENQCCLLEFLLEKYDKTRVQDNIPRQIDIQLPHLRSKATISTTLKVLQLDLKTRILMRGQSATFIHLPFPKDNGPVHSNARYEKFEVYGGKNEEFSLREGGMLFARVNHERDHELVDSSGAIHTVPPHTILVGWQHEQLPAGSPNSIFVSWQAIDPSADSRTYEASGSPDVSDSETDSEWGLPVPLYPATSTPAVSGTLSLKYGGFLKPRGSERIRVLTVNCSVKLP